MSGLKGNFILLFILLFFCSYADPISHLDSVLVKLKDEKRDSVRIKYLLDVANIYNLRGYAKEEAMHDAEEALNLANRNNYFSLQVFAYLDEGGYYRLKSDNQKALDVYLKALDICEKKSFKNLQVEVYNALSSFYIGSMRNYNKALDYCTKALVLVKQLGNKENLALCLGNMGTIYYNIDHFRQSLKYYLQALNVLDSIGDKNNAAAMTNNVGSTYEGLKVYDTAIAYYQKSLDTYSSMNDTDDIAMSYCNIGNVYNMKGDPEEGIKYIGQSLAMSRQVKDKQLTASAYGFLSEGYSKMGNYQKAYEYQTALSNLKDTLFTETNTKQVNDMQVKYDTEKKDRENKILELSVNRQKIINYSISLGLILVISLVFFVYRGYVNKKKAHEELGEKNRIIEEKNKDILDSINYAQTIQQVILTPPDYLKESLGEYFIVYKPRDVVSGDFYWCYANGSKVIFTVADCTGHGVPGAFMSMIGNSLLNEVVIENKVTDAAEILNNLRTGLLRTLQQKGHNNVTRDGMDLALCVWDKNKNTIQFAGANNSLYLVRDKVAESFNDTGKVKIHYETLAEFLPDKQPIGYFESLTDNPFSSNTVQLQRGDLIYISSDGYADQFGGEAAKKFSKKKFREMLVMISTKQIQEQKNILDTTVDSWKGSLTQTDDICLMGVKIS